MASRTPTRLTVPDPQNNAVFQDIYDKLQQIQQTVTPAPTPTPTPTPTPVTPVTPGGGGGGGGTPGTSYANIPDLTALPSTNPTLGLPYTQDGLPVIVSPTPSIPGPIYRYSTTGYVWTRETCPVLFDTHANRVANYAAANYPIAIFVETDTLLTLESDGTNWITISGQVSDTHANRLANWPSVQFSPGTLFYENDRTDIYQVANASGTLTVAGGVNVTWVSGSHFINTGTGFNAAQWPTGTKIVINGVTCTISVVNSPTSLTLSASTTNAAGVAFSVASGLWVWKSGMYEASYGSLPTNLGENDYGFTFSDTTHVRKFVWASTGGAPAATSPGWTRQQGEDPTGKIDILPFGPGYASTGWSLCNGGSISITQDDASTTSVTKPNFTGGAYPAGGTTGTYGPTGAAPNAAVVPTIGGHTDTGTAVIPAVASATGFAQITGATAVDTLVPAVNPVLVAPAGATTVSASPHTHLITPATAPDAGHQHIITVTDSGHQHTLSSANAPITLPGDPIPNVIVPFYMRR